MASSMLQLSRQLARRSNLRASPLVASDPVLPRTTTNLVKGRGLSDLADTDGRERVVILGSGWAGFVCARNLDSRRYKVTVVSPRNYFVFTPLLTDTAVGTLESRNALESVRGAAPSLEYIQAWADNVNFKEKTIDVEPAVLDPTQASAPTGEHRPIKESMLLPREEDTLLSAGGRTTNQHTPLFTVPYDKLIVTVGAYSQTFNTPGVRENAFFLKDIGDARRIRRRIIELFELASLPFVTDEAREQALHFTVVGAGPTGMEFCANLSDFLKSDLARLYPQWRRFVKISLFDVAPKVLPMFDAVLSDYAVNTYKRENIAIKTSHHVELLRKGAPHDTWAAENQSEIPPSRIYTLKTKEGGEIGTGMCVWSTGLMNNPFIAKALSTVRGYPSRSVVPTTDAQASEIGDKQTWTIRRDPKSGSLVVDSHLRVQIESDVQQETDQPVRATMSDVFALGDCATPESGTLPATAQVANQEAQYLAHLLNKAPQANDSGANNTSGQNVNDYVTASPPFAFKNKGVMTFLGNSKAIIQGPETQREGAARGLRGFLAYLAWRGAYLTMTLSWRNKVLILVQWIAVRIFGRSISRF